MGEEQLLQLAQEFLFSDAGKKLIGKDIDLSSLENQIKSDSSRSTSFTRLPGDSVYPSPYIKLLRNSSSASLTVPLLLLDGLY